jgi:hypothetical protein
VWPHRHRTVARSVARTALVAWLVATWGRAAGAQDAKDAKDARPGGRFRDPEDGAFDISTWLSGRTGFVPMVVPITEPALEYGAAAAVVYFHPRATVAGTRPAPPDLSVAGGMYTGSDSWGAVLGHLGYWRQDRIRYRGIAGHFSLNLDFYGVGGQLERPIAYNVRLTPLLQELSFRIGRTDLFVGGRYVYAKSAVDATLPIDLPAGVPAARESALGALGAVLLLDSRDNLFTPNRGVRVEASQLWYDDAFGGDYTYRYGRGSAFGYTPLGSRVVGALRVDARTVHGDAPFYALPYVDLRGVPALRYQNDAVLVLETEERWRVRGRWSLVGFGGVGATGDALDALSFDDAAWNAGLGGRYFIARKFGLHMGVDVARGPEQWAFYVVFGNTWR